MKYDVYEISENGSYFWRFSGTRAECENYVEYRKRSVKFVCDFSIVSSAFDISNGV